MGKKFKKVLITTGVVTLMSLSLVGCSKASTIETTSPVTTEADLNIRVNVPTTAVDIGNGNEVVKVLETYENGGFSGERENGDTFTKLNLPTLSTGRIFSETEAMEFESMNECWRTTPNEKKVVIARDGLIDIINNTLYGFTAQEKEEVADFVLAQNPIPATPASETKSQPAKAEPTKSQTQETKPQTNTDVKSTQPQVQPTQAPSSEELTAEEAAEWAAWEEHERMLEAQEPVHSYQDEPGYVFTPGYDNNEYAPINWGN